MQDELGNAGTNTDGFDTVFDDALSLLDSLDTALTSLAGADGGTLDDTFADALALDADAVAELAAQVGDALPGIDKTTNDLGDVITAATTPPPPSGGGGGGGGSGGGGGQGGPPTGPDNGPGTLMEVPFVVAYPKTGSGNDCEAGVTLSPVGSAAAPYPQTWVVSVYSPDAASDPVRALTAYGSSNGYVTVWTDFGTALEPGVWYHIVVKLLRPLGKDRYPQFMMNTANHPSRLLCLLLKGHA